MKVSEANDEECRILIMENFKFPALVEQVLDNPNSRKSGLQFCNSSKLNEEWIFQQSCLEIYYDFIMLLKDKVSMIGYYMILKDQLMNFIVNRKTSKFSLSRMLTSSIIYDDLEVFCLILSMKDICFGQELIYSAYDHDNKDMCKLILYDDRCWPGMSVEEKNDFERIFLNHEF